MHAKDRRCPEPNGNGKSDGVPFFGRDCEEESRAKVEAAGSKVNEVTNKVAFQERMAPVYDGFVEANPDLASVIEAIQAVQ